MASRSITWVCACVCVRLADGLPGNYNIIGGTTLDFDPYGFLKGKTELEVNRCRRIYMCVCVRMCVCVCVSPCHHVAAAMPLRPCPLPPCPLSP